MEPELLDYLRHIRPRMATTTYRRKRFQAESFCKYLAAEGKKFSDVNQSDIEKYLAGFTCSRQYRQAVCGVVREFFDVLRLRYPEACPQENPAADIVFKPIKGRRLPKVPSQAAIEEIFARLSGKDSDLHSK